MSRLELTVKKMCRNIKSLCCVSVSRSVMPNSLRLQGQQTARLLCPWDFPGKNTGVGCHSFLQGIFPTHGSNLGLLHCGHTLYCQSHQGRASLGGQQELTQCYRSITLLQEQINPQEKLRFLVTGGAEKGEGE